MAEHGGGQEHAAIGQIDPQPELEREVGTCGCCHGADESAHDEHPPVEVSVTELGLEPIEPVHDVTSCLDPRMGDATLAE